MTLDELEEELQKLSAADFNQLGLRLGFATPVRLEWAQIDINDDGKTPIAIIEYADGSKQKIDIFAAIRHNIMTVGNPIVLIAIHHWAEILRHRPALTFKDDWYNQEGVNGEILKAFREKWRSSSPDKASKNLARISETIIGAAKERSVSREDALVAWVQYKKCDQKNTLLYEAFEWLRKNKIDSDWQKLNKLEEALRKARVGNQSISIERVMGFLRSEKGERHIYPKRWDSMRNAFIAWHFGLSQDAVVKYFSKARKRGNKIDNEINTGFFFPRHNRYDLSGIGEKLLHFALILPAEAYLKVDEEDEDEGFGPPSLTI